MEPEGALPESQTLTAGSDARPNESSPHPLTLAPQDPFLAYFP
jgi:hypothetical protein